jgi:hypothetical protein
LNGELIDGISEAVLWSPHPLGRSATITSIVEEICETIAWLHRSTPAENDELASLHQLLVEAQAHQQRMAACRADRVVTRGAA